MGNLKDMLLSISGDEVSENEVEVYADSVRQALEIASRELGVEISVLDYDIIEKGTKGMFGIGRQPYRVVVRPLKVEQEHDDLDKIEKKLTAISDSDLVLDRKEKDLDGAFRVRVLKSGIWLTVDPPKGKGNPVLPQDVNNRLFALQINNADLKKVEKEIRKPSGKPAKVGEWIPKPEWDSSFSVEITDDEMKCFINFVPPKYSGRHMEIDDILPSMKSNGVVAGIKEDAINQYLEKMEYSTPLLAAEGTPPRHGRDAYVDYKVRIDKSHVSFEEDKETKKVDFKDLDLLENVVVGQVLAVKVPAQEGIPGRTVTNRVIAAKTGKDIQVRHGKGTILSEDGNELTAEINGQVVFQSGRLSVEPVYTVRGDVSLETGNIVFLGSVVIGGSVQDNFTVKAAGNIEVRGSVQKAFLEAEGDILVMQGIVGRDEARIESTSGSIFTKFVQGATLIAENDVVVSEGILHSNIDAGARVLCGGRKARIVGGQIRAGEEVNARFVGADAATKTEVRVGINPKVHQQLVELDKVKHEVETELDVMKKNVHTLTIHKNNSGGQLPADKEELLTKSKAQMQKLTNRQNEINLELEELRTYLSMLGQKGRICAEKTLFPGVDIYIKDKKYEVKDPYNHIKITLEGDNWRFGEYTPPDMGESGKGVMRMRRRR
ncbi:MAG TPA: FapA family protein [Spirochaetota bacterium]|nr:FapA family protein [Spirochaetota bacterium]HPJ37769.1 FapA family protein [Spirochaetota bacterium]HPQ52371.1 FapA family protein [Spirochaetota bacterium]